MPVSIGYIQFPDAYERHYANRFGAAPTAKDVEQANADLDEGLRKEAFAKRDLGLSKEEALPERPLELIRYREFIARQEAVQSEILDALKQKKLIAFVEDDNPLYITADEWRALAYHNALLGLFDSGIVQSPNKIAIKQSAVAYKVLGTAPYINEKTFEEWSQRICSAAQPKQGPLNLQNYDPLKLVEWSLPMASAWIAHRTADGLREYWDNYLLKIGRTPRSWDEFNVETALDEQLGDGFNQLSDAIGLGHLKASGTYLTSGEARSITREEWISPNRNRLFRHIRVFRPDVMDMWPATNPIKDQSPESGQVSETRVRLPIEGGDGLQLRQEIRNVANILWPNGKTPARPGIRNKAIIEHYEDVLKQPAPSKRTIERAFKSVR